MMMMLDMRDRRLDCDLEMFSVCFEKEKEADGYTKIDSELRMKPMKRLARTARLSYRSVVMVVVVVAWSKHEECEMGMGNASYISATYVC